MLHLSIYLTNFIENVFISLANFGPILVTYFILLIEIFCNHLDVGNIFIGHYYFFRKLLLTAFLFSNRFFNSLPNLFYIICILVLIWRNVIFLNVFWLLWIGFYNFYIKIIFFDFFSFFSKIFVWRLFNPLSYPRAL